MKFDNTDVEGRESVSPSRRLHIASSPQELTKQEEERLGSVAYEAFQGPYAAELTDAAKQHSPSRKPVPTGGRAAWEMLDKTTQETWIRVARAVARASQ